MNEQKRASCLTVPPMEEYEKGNEQKRESLSWPGNYKPCQQQQQKEEVMQDRNDLPERKTQQLEQPEIEIEPEDQGKQPEDQGHMTYDLLNEKVIKVIFHDAIVMVANEVTKENFLKKPFYDLESYDIHNETQFFVREELREKLVKKMKIVFKAKFKEAFKKELKVNLETMLLETLRTKIV